MEACQFINLKQLSNSDNPLKLYPLFSSNVSFNTCENSDCILYPESDFVLGKQVYKALLVTCKAWWGPMYGFGYFIPSRNELYVTEIWDLDHPELIGYKWSAVSNDYRDICIHQRYDDGEDFYTYTKAHKIFQLLKQTILGDLLVKDMEEHLENLY